MSNALQSRPNILAEFENFPHDIRIYSTRATPVVLLLRGTFSIELLQQSIDLFFVFIISTEDSL